MPNSFSASGKRTSKLRRTSSGSGPEAFGSNISETTFQKMRELIVHGKLAPGSRVVEADLAERLGVSRTPVRAALHRLRQEGYILGGMGGGGKARLAVAPLTQEDARELYWIVGHLEGLAARATAELEPKARGALVRTLRELNQALTDLAEAHRGEPSRTFDLDMSFHQAIVDASAGPRLLALHSAIKPQTERYWRLYASAVVDQLAISVAEHLEIIRGIEQGDREAAERAVELNWFNGGERLCQVIETLGERGSW